MRVEEEASRRGNATVVVSTLLSLLVVVVAVAVVAYLVLRSPATDVDSAERLDPVGTALPAPTDVPVLPTEVPTEEPDPEPTALGFTGEAPAVVGLPTVAAPQEDAGPTPTPRVLSLPTAVPTVLPTAIPPAPTLPPAVPVENIPVVALQPVESAPPAPTTAPSDAVTQPTPVPNDDDPFNIFDDEDSSGRGIVPSQGNPLEQVRAMQDEQRGRLSGSNDNDDDSRAVELPDIAVPDRDVPVISPTDTIPVVTRRDDPVEIVMPDVDAMIDDITERATDPSRNPNVNDPGRRVTEADDDDDDDDDDDRTSASEKRRKSARDRMKERTSRRTPTPSSGNVPRISRPGNSQNGDSSVCTDPTAEGFPFDC
jgi:hypothetical protein